MRVCERVKKDKRESERGRGRLEEGNKEGDTFIERWGRGMEERGRV